MVESKSGKKLERGGLIISKRWLNLVLVREERDIKQIVYGHLQASLLNSHRILAF